MANGRREAHEEIYKEIMVELAKTKQRGTIKNELLIVFSLVVLLGLVIGLFVRDIRKTYLFTIEVAEWLIFFTAIVLSRLMVKGILSLVILFLKSNFLLKGDVVSYSHN